MMPSVPSRNPLRPIFTMLLLAMLWAGCAEPAPSVRDQGSVTEPDKTRESWLNRTGALDVRDTSRPGPVVIRDPPGGNPGTCFFLGPSPGSLNNTLKDATFDLAWFSASPTHQQLRFGVYAGGVPLNTTQGFSPLRLRIQNVSLADPAEDAKGTQLLQGWAEAVVSGASLPTSASLEASVRHNSTGPWFLDFKPCK